MAPHRVRVSFRTMDRAGSLGLRALRREFGEFGEITCAVLHADSARQPDAVEVEFSSNKATLKVKSWSGENSDLPLYRPEGLIDPLKRDSEASFLCYVDNFDKTINSFEDLADFVTFVTDVCSVTLKNSALCWSPLRGTFARVECQHKSDQERLIKKMMDESYLGMQLSCSSVAGGEYAGVGDGGYRVDWKVVVGEAAQAGLEKKQGNRLNKKDAKKDLRKAKKKAKKEKKKEKKRLKKERKKAKAANKKDKKSKLEEPENKDNKRRREHEDSSKSKSSAGSSSSSPSKPLKENDAGGHMQQMVANVTKPGRAPMALLGSEASSSSNASSG